MKFVESVLDFKDRVLELLFPPRCIFCSEVVPIGKCVCNNCSLEVVPSTMIRTILEFGEENIACISPFKYSGKVRKAIWSFKFRGQKQYAKYFAQVVSDELEKTSKNIDVVTAVPLSESGMRKRGYNQSECLAKLIAKNIGLKYEDLLIKSRENFPQHELTLNERRENVKGVYKVTNIRSLKNKNILLCDDVVTTGSTLRECAKMLKLFGARSVICCTVAYV